MSTPLWGEMNGISWRRLCPSTPALVECCSSLPDTLLSLLDTFPWEATSPGGALELEQGLQGNRSCAVTAHSSEQANPNPHSAGKAFLLTVRGSLWWAAGEQMRFVFNVNF